ncbi:MAG: diacylglycerol kinase family protein [Verrucomicrobiae bacterium]|nr:diacylglycerol kinase family protein [Verrucomicrobiae bacterium]
MRTGARRYRGLQSFIDAGRGLVTVLRTEWNFRIHAVIALLVTLAGFLFQISSGEWLAVVLSAGVVFMAEVFNTAIEYLADAVHPEADRGVGMAKDAAAGGVLIAAVAAAIVGAIVFLPKGWAWLTTL